jgi:hypothetical protein
MKDNKSETILKCSLSLYRVCATEKLCCSDCRKKLGDCVAKEILSKRNKKPFFLCSICNEINLVTYTKTWKKWVKQHDKKVGIVVR